MKKDPGFYAGIIYACGYLVGSHGEDTLAEYLFQESGLTKDSPEIKKAAEYDVAILRRIIPGLPKGKK